MASTTKVTHPFHSPFIQSALQQIAKSDERQRTSSGLISSHQIESDTSNDEREATSDSSEESDGSTSEAEEETQPVPELPTDQLTKTVPIKKNIKKARSRPMKLNNAPSIMLPLPHDNESQHKHQLALSIPTIMLPNNYIRNNPNYKSSEVATHLLSTWDALQANPSPAIIILLLQSGRFASAVYTFQKSQHFPSGRMVMLAHKTSTRYTVRKGQGGSQSAHDSKSKAKSMGAQLRREGERQLRLDVVNTWKEWKEMGYIDRSWGVWIAVPKAMRKEYLFGGEDGSVGALIDKNDGRLRSIPLDYGRPTLEAVEAVMECLMRCEVGELSQEDVTKIVGEDEPELDQGIDHVKTKGEHNGDTLNNVKEIEKQLPEAPPLTPLHEAVMAGDLYKVTELLQVLKESEQSYDINTQGGEEYQTPLHFASSSTHKNASAILNVLLVQARANPCSIDARGRPPYYLAATDKIRETFRLARGKLGEDYCDWDAAKVGPALTADDIEAKRLKAIEKKQRQRARKKEKKIEEAKVKAEEEEKAAKLKAEEDAKRARDGLKPKTGTGNACDFCMKLVKKKSNMYQRLQYYYCSTDCVKRHQRELAANAPLCSFWELMTSIIL